MCVRRRAKLSCASLTEPSRGQTSLFSRRRPMTANPVRVSAYRATTATGVTARTLRNWEAKGLIRSRRSPTGHRVHDLSSLRSGFTEEPETAQESASSEYLINARVSSHRSRRMIWNVRSGFCQRNSLNTESYKTSVQELIGSGQGSAPLISAAYAALYESLWLPTGTVSQGLPSTFLSTLSQMLHVVHTSDRPPSRP